MRHTHLTLAAVVLAVMTASPADAQKATKGVGGKKACALLSAAEIRRAAGRNDVAPSAGQSEELDYTSNCQYWGPIDITIHLGTQTKVMFGRERDNYAKAPARLGYKVERLAGLGDDAYFLGHNGKAEARVMIGETELAIGLSGSLPPEADAKKMALNIARAAAAKLR